MPSYDITRAARPLGPTACPIPHECIRHMLYHCWPLRRTGEEDKSTKNALPMDNTHLYRIGLSPGGALATRCACGQWTCCTTWLHPTGSEAVDLVTPSARAAGKTTRPRPEDDVSQEQSPPPPLLPPLPPHLPSLHTAPTSQDLRSRGNRCGASSSRA